MAVTEDILVRLRVQGQQQFAGAMGGAATQTERLGDKAKTTGGHVEDTGKKAKTAGGQVRGFAGGVAKFAAATGALMAAQKIVTDSVKNAVSLGEETAKAQQVFGPASRSVENWAKTTSKAYGVSRVQALEASGALGNMLTPLGVSEQKAAGMSKSMVELAADMASFNNVPVDEALGALRSGLAGEAEPLKRFGVSINEARLQQIALEDNLVKGKGPLDAQAKAQAAYALIMQDTAKQQGDVQRNYDSLPNQLARLKAGYAGVTAEIGGKLLPILNWLMGNLPEVAIVTGAVALAWIAWGAGAAIAATGTGTLSGAVAALGAVILANPIGLIAVALIALVAGLVIAYRKVDWFRKGVDAAFKWIKNAFGDVVGFVKTLPAKISSAASGMWDGIKESFRSAINAVLGWWNALDLSFNVPDFIPGVPDRVSVQTPNVPLLAGGGTITSSGAAIVGERGPELVTLPAGASVTPGGGIIHTHVYLNGREIATAVGNATADRMARR